MAEPVDELLDYADEDEDQTEVLNGHVGVGAAAAGGVHAGSGALGGLAGPGTDDKETKKGSYVGIHATGFRDFLLKPELLRAIGDCGFEHPSEGD
ncbi:hypothetical protein BSLG_002382 [Batrachochytrium salamandrivorans]|nr:hypothetical protein BSLG_002382 [Batrachochytrium salamandrivorans]